MRFGALVLTLLLVFVAQTQASPVCDQLNKSYESLCSRKKTDGGFCLLKNNKSILKALDLIQSSPQVSQKDIEATKKFYAAKSPSVKDIEDEITRESTNCWNAIHFHMWKSIAASFDAKSSAVRKRALAVLKKRNALEENSSNLSYVMVDAASILDAAQAHMISASLPALRELEAMRANHLAKSKEFTAKWDKLLPKKGEQLPEGSDVKAIAQLMAEEHQYTSQERQRLQHWVSQNLK